MPPVNVRDDELDDAFDRLRDAAHRTRPFRLLLGPTATFLPINPVVYLSVDGDVAAVDALRDRVFRPPLERPLTWPFQPHVTLLDGGSPERVAAGVEALASFTAEATFDGVHLLREERDDATGERRWRSIAEAPFGGPAVVGRGGLELELQVASDLPADAVAFRDRAFDEDRAVRYGEVWRPAGLAVVARRDGRVVATADGEVRPDGEAYLAKLIVASDQRDGGIGAHVVAAFASAAAERGATVLTLRTEDGGPAERFYVRLGFERRFTLPRWRSGRDYVQMGKSL